MYYNIVFVLRRLTPVQIAISRVLNVRVLDPTTAPDALLYSASQRTAGVFHAVEKTHTKIPQDFPGNAVCAVKGTVKIYNLCINSILQMLILTHITRTFNVKPSAP